MTDQFEVSEEGQGASRTGRFFQGSATRRSFLTRSVASAAIIAPAAGLLMTQTANAATLSAHALSAEDAFHEIRKDEDAHVSFLKSALGSYARPKPTFKELKQDDRA